MKLAMAIAVARHKTQPSPITQLLRDPEIIMFRARNGEWMTGRIGAAYLRGRTTWTFEEFLKEYDQ